MGSTILLISGKTFTVATERVETALILEKAEGPISFLTPQDRQIFVWPSAVAAVTDDDFEVQH